MMIRNYTELTKIDSYEKRFEYLKIGGKIGIDTFGHSRYLNQILYKCDEWKKVRREVIIRDKGCDLGISGYEIFDKIIVHHMNPITIEDVLNRKPEIFDPEYLISVSHNTHNALHYGDKRLLCLDPIERRPNDTCPWRR